jgi:hypothetical protein
VFELLIGPHWTLFEYDSPRSGIDCRSGLAIHRIGTGLDYADIQGEFADAYDVKAGELVLVRPDGYVAAITTADRAGDLETYLQEKLPDRSTDHVPRQRP